uniref:Uncharacterized protein n=1 Tax=Rhizophora mucronata TaxID=61149 RepID=A0A2P2PM14_RHIMU
MTMNLMSSLPALIHQRQLKQGSHVGSFAGQSYEQRHIGGVILRALPIWIKIDCPCIAPNYERIRCYVLADPHALGKRVSIDPKLVGPINGLGARGGGGRRYRGRWG